MVVSQMPSWCRSAGGAHVCASVLVLDDDDDDAVGDARDILYRRETGRRMR
jgi:hypothetical protein